MGIRMVRKGYKSITIPEDLYQMINELKKKYRMTSIELIREALNLFDEIMERCRKIR